MKQKILIRITMTDDKTRAKAMKTAAQFKGVSAVEIKGDHRNQIEVTGVEVNMVCLTNTLRKKVAFAELVSVNKVEPPKKPEDDKKKDDKKTDEKKADEKKTDEKKKEEKKPTPCCKPAPCCKPEPCCKAEPCCKPAPCCKPEPCCKAEPCCCYPSYPPWPYGYGVPSSFPHPCDPFGYNSRDYTGYNHGPNGWFM